MPVEGRREEPAPIGPPALIPEPARSASVSLSPVARWLRTPISAWRHPILTARRLAGRRTWPSRAEFDRMDDATFERYLVINGFYAKVKAALAHGKGHGE